MSSSRSRTKGYSLDATLLAPDLAPTNALRALAPTMMQPSGLTLAAAYGIASEVVTARGSTSHSPMPKPLAINEHADTARARVPNQKPRQLTTISNAMMSKKLTALN